jgi:hypothetical protein
VGVMYGPHGRGERCMQGLVRKPKAKRPLRRSRHRWEGSIEGCHKEMG